MHLLMLSDLFIGTRIPIRVMDNINWENTATKQMQLA